MKEIICVLILCIHSFYLHAQTDKDTAYVQESVSKPVYRSNNIVGLLSVGSKNTYGAFGVFVGRSFDLGKFRFDVRLGCGTKNSLVVGGGIDLKVATIKQKIEFFVAGDYSYQYAGTIRYDDEKKYQPYTSDEYKVSACQYIHSSLNTRFFVSKDKFAALQVKTGYGFLVNDVSIVPEWGPDVSYARAEHSVESGLMLGLDFIFYVKFFDDFKRQKVK